MPPSGVDYASEFLNGYAPEYVQKCLIMRNQFQWCHNMMDHIIIKVALMLHLNLYLTLNN